MCSEGTIQNIIVKNKKQAQLRTTYIISLHVSLHSDGTRLAHWPSARRKKSAAQQARTRGRQRKITGTHPKSPAGDSEHEPSMTKKTGNSLINNTSIQRIIYSNTVEPRYKEI